MRRLIVTGLVLAALAAGLAFAVTATQAQTGDTVTIVVDSSGKVVSVTGKAQYKPPSKMAPESVNTKTPPLSVIVFFTNPPGCVFIPNTGDWHCP